MLESLRTLMLAGLGTLGLTEDKVQAVLEDLIKRGELTEQEARELAGHWRQQWAQSRDELRQNVRETVWRALHDLDVASREDVAALMRRVEALERRARARPASEPVRQASEAEVDVEC